jgi:very-short-patch-repair endonuclease
MGRVDLVYLAYKLIIEHEGDQHRTDRYQWNHDIDRHEDFARDNWTLIRVTSERARWPRQVVRAVTRPSGRTDTTTRAAADRHRGDRRIRGRGRVALGAVYVALAFTWRR